MKIIVEIVVRVPDSRVLFHARFALRRNRAPVGGEENAAELCGWRTVADAMSAPDVYPPLSSGVFDERGETVTAEHSRAKPP